MFFDYQLNQTITAGLMAYDDPLPAIVAASQHLTDVDPGFGTTTNVISIGGTVGSPG